MRECPVQRCGSRDSKAVLNGRANTTRFRGFGTFKATLQKAECDIQIATVIALNFGALGWLEITGK